MLFSQYTCRFTTKPLSYKVQPLYKKLDLQFDKMHLLQFDNLTIRRKELFYKCDRSFNTGPDPSSQFSLLLSIIPFLKLLTGITSRRSSMHNTQYKVQTGSGATELTQNSTCSLFQKVKKCSEYKLIIEK